MGYGCLMLSGTFVAVEIRACTLQVQNYKINDSCIYVNPFVSVMMQETLAVWSEIAHCQKALSKSIVRQQCQYCLTVKASLLQIPSSK